MNRSPDLSGRHPLFKLLGVAFLMSLVLGLLPVFSRMFGYNFLPSYQWISRSHIPGLAAGLVLAAALLWGVWKGQDKIEGRMKKALGFTSAPFLGFLLGKNVIVVAPPMILALIAGHQIETSFIVAHANQSGTRGCRSPVKLQELPFLFDSVCRVKAEFRRTLSPGMQVVVNGYGTQMGIFAEGIRKVD